MSQVKHRQRLRERQGLGEEPQFDPSFVPVAAALPLPRLEPEDETPLTMDQGEETTPEVPAAVPPANSPGPISTAHPAVQPNSVTPYNPEATAITVTPKAPDASSPGPSQHPAMHPWPEGEDDGYTLSPEIVAGKQ
jgi:hypothetical protein